MSKSKLIEKIEQKLVDLGIVTLAEEVVETGSTETNTEEIGSVVISEIIPTPIDVTYSAIGAPVIIKNAEGEEENLGDGEYLLKDNMKMIIVDGKLKELIKIEETEEEVVLSKETKVEKVETKEVKVEEVKVEETKVEETKVELTETEELELAVTNIKSLLSTIDMTKAGDYYISISINDSGEITYATASSNTYQNLLLAEEEKTNKKVDELVKAYEVKLSDNETKYKNIIEALKTGYVKPTEPKVEEVKLSRVEALKIQIQAKREEKNK